MNSNVIEFPTRIVRHWIEIEKIIRGNLERSGAAPEMVDEVCGRIKESWKKFDIQISIPFQFPAGLPEWVRKAIDDSLQKLTKSVADQIHEYTSNLMLDRLHLEIELYNLRHQESEKP